MTDAEKDAVWRLLPDGFKKEVSRHYKSWHNSLAFGSECAVLDYLFGKHNLTASEEDKPRFSKGDIVIYVGADNPDCKGSIFAIDGDIYFNDYYKCLMASSISNVKTHICNVPLTDLSPYTEEQEPKEVNKVRKINVGDIVRVKRETPSNLYNNMPYAFVDMPFFVTEIEEDCDNNLNDTAHLRNGSTYLNIHPHWLQKEDVHHKWETKDGRQEVVDMTLKTWLDSTPDWLAYRMELAKEVVNGLLFTGKSPETIADETTTIVNGIVERLKGGEK